MTTPPQFFGPIGLDPNRVQPVYTWCTLCTERFESHAAFQKHACRVKATPEYQTFLRERRAAAERAANATVTCDCGHRSKPGTYHTCKVIPDNAMPNAVDEIAAALRRRGHLQ